MFKKSAVIVFISLLIVSCSTINKKAEKGVALRKNKLFSLPPWNSELKNLEIKANLSVSNNNQSYNASANIRIAKLDSISMKINGPFGISVGKLYANPNYFDFYNAITDQLIEGKPNAENFQQIIKMPVSYNDLIRLLRCETPGKPSDFVFVKQIGDNPDNNLFKNDNNPDYIEYAVVSAKDLTLKQYQRKLRNGKIIFHVFFDDYETIDGIKYSMRQFYKFPEINSSLTFKINNMEINPFFEKAFKILYPENMNKIKLN